MTARGERPADTGPAAPPPATAIVICTRDRPEHLRRTLEALDRQSQRDFRVTVVDQSGALDPELERRQREDDRLTLIRDPGTGLSRARNIGWKQTVSDWLIYIDDDSLPDPDWLEQMEKEIAAHPEAAYVTCDVDAAESPEGGRSGHRGYKVYSVFEVRVPQLLSGRWVRPARIGFGVCMAARRTTIEQLGGWDERLGAGAPDFPASDDMDFNYRLLRSGGIAYLTPHARLLHDQWRSPEQLVSLYRGYTAAGSGYAMKHLRQGDVLGGLWLWWFAVRDTARAFASSGKHRSWLRFRIALAKLAGLVTGTAKGITRSWSGPEMPAAQVPPVSLAAPEDG